MKLCCVILSVVFCCSACAQNRDEEPADDKTAPASPKVSSPQTEEPKKPDTPFAAYPVLRGADNLPPERLISFVREAPLVNVPIPTIIKYLPNVGRELWSNVKVRGNKMGYNVERWERISIKNKPYLQSISISLYEYRRMGIIHVEYYVTKSIYEAFGEGALVRIEKRGHTNKEKNLYTLERLAKGKYRRTSNQNLLAKDNKGFVREQVLHMDPGSIMNSGLAVQVLLAKNGVTGTRSYKIRDYSFNENRLTDAVIAIFSQQKVHLRGKAPEQVHVASIISATPPGVGHLLFSRDGEVLHSEFGVYTSVVTTQQEAMERFEHFEYRSIMVTPTPIRGITKKTRELSITFRGNLPVGIEMLNLERYRVTRKNNFQFTMTLKRDTLRGLKSLPTPPDLAQYLKPTARIESDDPLIVALSKKAVRGASSKVQKVRRLVTFVSRYMKGNLDYNLNSAVAVARAKSGDCTEHTLLFVALARAQKIPARRVGGLMCGNTRRGCLFIGHAWPQVWLGRWIDVDPTWNQQTADVTHVLLSTGDDHRSARLLGSLKYVSHKIIK